MVLGRHVASIVPLMGWRTLFDSFLDWRQLIVFLFVVTRHTEKSKSFKNLLRSIEMVGICCQGIRTLNDESVTLSSARDVVC